MSYNLRTSLAEEVLYEALDEEIVKMKVKKIIQEKLENGDFDKLLKDKIDDSIGDVIDSYFEDGMLYDLMQKPLNGVIKKAVKEGFKKIADADSQ